jgi:dCTP deaminase
MTSATKEAIASCVLSDTAIEELMAHGANIVEPFDLKFLQPASLDLRLGSSVYSYRLESYALGENIEQESVLRESFTTLTLEPGETAFIGLYERISIPQNMMGIVFPRSSITRLGIRIQTVYMNPGYAGVMPLTITNNMGVPLTLSPGKRVAQLVLLSLGEMPKRTYKNIDDSKYYLENADHSQLHTDRELQERVDATFRRHFNSLFD